MQYNLLEFINKKSHEESKDILSITISNELYGDALPKLTKKICQYLGHDKDFEEQLNHPKTNVEIQRADNIERVGLAFVPKDDWELELVTPLAEDILVVANALNKAVTQLDKLAEQSENQSNNFKYQYNKMVDNHCQVAGQQIVIKSKAFENLINDYIKLIPKFPTECQITNFTCITDDSDEPLSDTAISDSHLNTKNSEVISPIHYVAPKNSIATRKVQNKTESLTQTIKGQLITLGCENNEHIEIKLRRGKSKIFISAGCEKYYELFKFKGKKTYIEFQLRRKSIDHEKYLITNYLTYEEEFLL
ncbi:hypothetical protein [Thalassomonas sp. M1454]|uniref:hypothetical protein n=1 Tax=Thalassomonas sp. M1454 TaxID=2594477 RepID=UPI0011811089|nr:hypothetical protein [Thalassomonas sp. M1454]TRX57968.1 hypothetical protein FNN08_00850 [Thalassomonas sp. M1454]